MSSIRENKKMKFFIKKWVTAIQVGGYLTGNVNTQSHTHCRLVQQVWLEAISTRWNNFWGVVSSGKVCGRRWCQYVLNTSVVVGRQMHHRNLTDQPLEVSGLRLRFLYCCLWLRWAEKFLSRPACFFCAHSHIAWGRGETLVYRRPIANAETTHTHTHTSRNLLLSFTDRKGKWTPHSLGVMSLVTY